MECDDEFWLTDTPELEFAQPPDLPSKISAFDCMLRLTRIHADAYRVMVSSACLLYFVIKRLNDVQSRIKSSSAHSEPEQAMKVIAGLDSKLNQFVDSVPEHRKISFIYLRMDYSAESTPLQSSGIQIKRISYL